MFFYGIFFALACALAVIVVIAVYEPDPTTADHRPLGDEE